MSYSGEGVLIEGEIEGSSTKEVRSIVCDANGHLLTASGPPAAVDYFTRILTGQIKDNEVLLFDRPSNFLNSYEYVGLSEIGSSRSANDWYVVRATWVNNRKIAMSFLGAIAWNLRASLAWPE